MKYTIAGFIAGILIIVSSAFQNDSQMTNQTDHHPYYSRTDTTKLVLPDSTWKSILDEDTYLVARKAATERAFTGEYWNFEGLGCALRPHFR